MRTEQYVAKFLREADEHKIEALSTKCNKSKEQ